MTATQNAQLGTFTISLQGTSGSLTHNLELSLAVAAAPPPADFSLTVAPATISLQAGGNTQSFTVSAAALNGFSGMIDVALSGLPDGVAAMPATLMLSPGTAQQISLNAPSTTAGGTATLIVEANSGSITHDAQVTVKVQPAAPDFSLSLNPDSISLPIGGATQQVSITANAVGAFSSPVDASITGLPAGVTASPSSLTLTPGGSQTISLQAGSSATAEQTSVTLLGVSGTETHSATLSLAVAPLAPDFQFFAGPSTLNLSTIADQELTIALIPMNGFNGAATVTVSGLPLGVSAENPPLPLVANIPQTIRLNAGNGPGTATPGRTLLTITATSGNITHSIPVNLVISTPTLDFNPTVFTLPTTGYTTPIPGLLLTPGTYAFAIQLSSAGGPDSGIAVQLSGLVPGTGLDQNQYTFTPETSRAVFNITVTPNAVGERGILTAAFTGAQINHEIDFPIYVVPQPTVFSYIPPLTIQQGEAADLLYEAASTSSDGVQLFLGPGWPQDFWLNPYPVDPNSATNLALGGVALLGQYSVSADANAASGVINLPFEFTGDQVSQVVSVPAQIVPFADFNVTAEPTTIALNAGATETFIVSASASGAFSGTINVSLDNLPAGLQPSPQSFKLDPGTSQTVTLATGSGYSAGGVLSVDSTSGSLAHSTQLAVSPGSLTGDLVVTGNTFSALGVAQIYNSGTYNGIAAISPDTTQALLTFVPNSAQFGSNTSNCGGSTTNLGCTPVNIAIYDSGTVSPVLDQPGTISLNANIAGVQSAVLHFNQILPDFTLSFSPANLTIPAGGSAALSVTYSAISPTFTQYCSSPFVDGVNGRIFNATITAPPPLGPLSAPNSSVDLCNPQSVAISAPANVPPGNYELSVATQLSVGYRPYFNPAATVNPTALIAAAHTFGVPVTVTAAPAPSFQLSASPAVINVAAGQSFPVTISATASNGFAGPISVSAVNLPSGVTISPSGFTMNAGSSQAITVSVAAGTAAVSDEVTLTGTSGSTTSSTGISVSITAQ